MLFGAHLLEGFILGTILETFCFTERNNKTCFLQQMCSVANFKPLFFKEVQLYSL